MNGKDEKKGIVPRSSAIREVLAKLQENDEFEEIFLTSPDGLVIASTPTTDDDKIVALAALMVQMRRSAQQIRKQLGWSPLNKVTMRGDDGQQLIGYGFTAGDCDLMLVILAPEQQAYQQPAIQAVRAIQRIHSTCNNL